MCINTAIYLPWLVGQCRKNGVVFKRAIFNHVNDAAFAHHSGQKADIVVNCTGLSSRKLGGVLDDTLLPARGQIVVVRNDPGVMCSISGSDDGDDEVTYIMTRAAGMTPRFGTLLNWAKQYCLQAAEPSSVVLIRRTTGIPTQILTLQCVS